MWWKLSCWEILCIKMSFAVGNEICELLFIDSLLKTNILRKWFNMNFCVHFKLIKLWELILLISIGEAKKKLQNSEYLSNKLKFSKSLTSFDYKNNWNLLKIEEIFVHLLDFFLNHVICLNQCFSNFFKSWSPSQSLKNGDY